MDKDLKSIIVEKIKEVAPITFAEFVSLALYHPCAGYYMTEKEKIGACGDYYTSSNVSEIFGLTLASHFLKTSDELDLPITEIVEFGAGTGQLAFDILNSIEKSGKQFKYYIAEVSPNLKKQQKDRLSIFQNVSWLTSGELKNLKINGIIFSNELVDSFPFHRIVKRKNRILEIFVDYDEASGKLFEVEKPASADVKEYMRKYGKELEEGQFAEVNMDALNWTETAAGILNKGCLITIDYGYEAEELYSPSRPQGTAISFSEHKASTDFYNAIGRRDITSFVNFTALIKRGEELGLENIYYNSQGRYLTDFGAIGILEKKLAEIKPPVERFKAQIAFKNLFLPQGMGEKFKVLIQRRRP
jgi:SAM-dependent MidA family methyltransferase